MRIPKLWHDGDGVWWALLVFVCAVPVAFAAAAATDVDRRLASYRDRGPHELDRLTLSGNPSHEAAVWGAAMPAEFGSEWTRGCCGREAFAPAEARRCCAASARAAAGKTSSPARFLATTQTSGRLGRAVSRRTRRSHMHEPASDRPRDAEVGAVSGVAEAHGRALGGDVVLGATGEPAKASAAAPRRQCAHG